MGAKITNFENIPWNADIHNIMKAIYGVWIQYNWNNMHLFTIMTMEEN